MEDDIPSIVSTLIGAVIVVAVVVGMLMLVLVFLFGMM